MFPRATTAASTHSRDTSLYENVTQQALQLGHTRQSWEALGNVYDPYSTSPFLKDVYKPLLPPSPVAVVEASKPREAPALTAVGGVVPGTPVDAILRQWAAPMAIGRGAASTPLAVIGTSIFLATIHVLRALKLRSFPREVAKTSDMLSGDELPVPGDRLKHELFMDKTKNAHLVLVYFTNMRSLAWFVMERMPHVHAACPNKSFVLFSPDNAPATPDALPTVVRERCTVVTWRDTRPAVPPAPVVTPSIEPSPELHLVEASHVRLGGSLMPGVTPAQRLGFEHADPRALAYLAMKEATVERARYYSATEGVVRDAKRMRLDDFGSPARVGDAAFQGGGDFGRFTFA